MASSPDLAPSPSSISLSGGQMKGAKAKNVLSKQTEETNLKKKKQLESKDENAKKRQTSKDLKAEKDPNKPKRPPTTFFVFLEEFRKTFKASNPNNKSVLAVGKAGGEKWKSMSDVDKAPYAAKASARKAEYEKTMQAYNAKQDKASDDVGGEESDKSNSEEEEEDDD